uniref:DUF4371 domain-containing protein n=2 Tax=Nicotiana TaxID=4085 RepID=A0A1S4DF85_TOBAC
MDDLNGDFFPLLVDESCDVSRKEQLDIVLRYVNRCGSVVEHFIGIVHCYDGASNMQGDLGGLETLIQQESKSAYSIHYFAHQLQLTLVAVSKKCLEVGELVLLVSNVLNIVGGSYKRMDDLRESQAEKVQEALDMGELETGRVLNQELGLARAPDTRWGLQYKNFKNFISIFGSIIDVLDTIIVDAWTLEERAKAKGYLITCQTFEKRLQKLREEEWGLLIDKVSAFCVKYNILIPNFDDFYVNSERSRRKIADYTILHHYRVDIFFKIIDWQVQELNARFNE